MMFCVSMLLMFAATEGKNDHNNEQITEIEVKSAIDICENEKRTNVRRLAGWIGVRVSCSEH